MNFNIVRRKISKLLLLESAVMLVPLIVGLLYRESFRILGSFLITMAIILLFSFLIGMKSERKETLHTKEGMVIVSLTWILWSVFGALPFVFAGEIPGFVDAFFEMCSGFTTTGATILKDVEIMSRAHLFWRSFTHLIGGMGVLVFALAVFPKGSSESVYLMRAEVPGPIFDKLVSRIRNTAMILYEIYLVMTAITIVLLLFGGMDLFDASCHAFGIAGTGGFSTYNASMAHFHSPYIEWVSALMMMFFGMNFNLFYLIVAGHFVEAIKNEELKIYLSIIGVTTALVMLINAFNENYTFLENLRHSYFAIVSLMTTSGFVAEDFSKWGLGTAVIFMFVMFVGGMAGSTGGGIKVARVGVLGKTAKSELKSIKNPRRIGVLSFNGKPIDEKQVTKIRNYFIIYMICVIVIFFLISLEDNLDFRTAFSSTMTTFNNIGAGFATGTPGANMADFSVFSKILLSFAMIAGRLEIYPLLILFTPSTYSLRS